MRTASYDDQSMLDVFAKEKILTREQLLNRLGCSWMTVWRMLNAQGYLTSYNNNARDYTLANTPRFDEHGLWRCGKARFSRYGTLTKTIVGLVGQSTAGLYADELQRCLRVTVRPTLSRLIRASRVRRHRLAGRFLYLDREPARAHKQLENRSTETTSTPELPVLPDPATIIALLVERIKTPGVGPELITRRLRRRGLPLNTAQARAVFAHYGLTQKKG